jgi:hypothetical protein
LFIINFVRAKKKRQIFIINSIRAHRHRILMKRPIPINDKKKAQNATLRAKKAKRQGENPQCNDDNLFVTITPIEIIYLSAARKRFFLGRMDMNWINVNVSLPR